MEVNSLATILRDELFTPKLTVEILRRLNGSPYLIAIIDGGIQRTKKDGTKVDVPFSPCNLVITELNLEDKKRREAAERKEKK